MASCTACARICLPKAFRGLFFTYSLQNDSSGPTVSRDMAQFTSHLIAVPWFISNVNWSKSINSLGPPCVVTSHSGSPTWLDLLPGDKSCYCSWKSFEAVKCAHDLFSLKTSFCGCLNTETFRAANFMKRERGKLSRKCCENFNLHIIKLRSPHNEPFSRKRNH